MATSAWKIYDKFKEYMGDGTIDLDSHTFKMALFLSASNCETLSLDEYGDLTNEVATGNGYTQGGVTLGSVTWTEVNGVVTFDFADPSWVAAGGSITARHGLVYDDTPSGSPAKPLVGYTTLDATPRDVTVTDGNTLTVVISPQGLFRQTGGN